MLSSVELGVLLQVPCGVQVLASVEHHGPVVLLELVDQKIRSTGEHPVHGSFSRGRHGCIAPR